MPTNRNAEVVRYNFVMEIYLSKRMPKLVFGRPYTYFKHHLYFPFEDAEHCNEIRSQLVCEELIYRKKRKRKKHNKERQERVKNK